MNTLCLACVIVYAYNCIRILILLCLRLFDQQLNIYFFKNANSFGNDSLWIVHASEYCYVIKMKLENVAAVSSTVTNRQDRPIRKQYTYTRDYRRTSSDVGELYKYFTTAFRNVLLPCVRGELPAFAQRRGLIARVCVRVFMYTTDAYIYSREAGEWLGSLTSHDCHRGSFKRASSRRAIVFLQGQGEFTPKEVGLQLQ